MKVQISKIYRSFKDKDGNPLKFKDGREFEKMSIQTKEYGSQWIGGIVGNWNTNFKIGDIVDVDIEQKGEYLNFKRPDPLKALEERVARIEAELWVRKPDEEVKVETGDDTDGTKTGDIPFN
jgi:hypothetical protein